MRKLTSRSDGLLRMGPIAAVGRRASVQRLGPASWLVSRGRGPQVKPVGPPTAGSHLLLNRRALRRDPQVHELDLAGHLSEEHVAWMLRELDVNCVLDVGANRGQYAKRLRRAGYTGRIVSFEPVDSFAATLERRARKDADWRVVRAALGSEDAVAEIGVAGGAGKMSSLLEPSEFGRSWSANINQVARQTVSVRRLDGLLDEVVAGIDEPRVYLKLDTQGFDLEAFAGAGERVADLVGMQSEVSAVPIYDGMPKMTAQLDTYLAAGFELTGMFPISIDRASLRVIEFDAVLIRPDRLRRR